MHRQSIGSPNSKLHSSGVSENIQLTTDDLKTKQQQQQQVVASVEDEQLRKSKKAYKSPEKLIHIIPMLIIFCFLILYLTSHPPPPQIQSVTTTDLKGFIEISSEIDNKEGVSASDVLSIGSTRNLQQEERTRINRKLR